MALSVIESQTDCESHGSIDWAEVQLEQFQHDEKYHREISRLSTQDRLRHMALHFAKYSGQLHDDPSGQQFRKIALDTLIIGISTANTLNVDLGKMLKIEPQASLLDEEFMKRLAVSAGKMAAACEKLDHLEEFPFRQTLTAQCLSIISACLSLFVARGWEPTRAMHERLASIKSKSIFYGKI